MFALHVEAGICKGDGVMPAQPYKGDEARYDVITTRLTVAETLRLQRFAQERNITVSSASRMLIMTGMELLGDMNYAAE